MSRQVKRKVSRATFVQHELRKGRCIEVNDSSNVPIPADFLLREVSARDPHQQIVRLANQFIEQNEGLLRNFGIAASTEYDGTSVNLVVNTSTRIGAFPLISPTSGRPDYGLVINPRYGWQGIGPMLGTMGWRVVPQLLRLPLLPYSDRKIPPWVLSTVILLRIKALLDHLERRFEYTETDLLAPRGAVNWAAYATTRMPSAKFLQVPCRFPDLRDDRELKAAIHYTLRKQLASLETQRNSGIVVLQLIALCQTLLQKVHTVPAKQPSSQIFSSWLRGPFKTQIFRDGLQAIEWAIDDRGLAGLSDFQGLPWVMPMEEFFEAWVETIVVHLARRVGGQVRTGRKRETVTPLLWEPPYLGSQKFLLPDIVLEREGETIIFDAKYKSHWEELTVNRWGNIEETIRERHREDLLQILAYSTLFTTQKIIGCLVYPCTRETWASLAERKMLYHHASIVAGERKVDVVLTAFPMNGEIEEIVDLLASMIERRASW